MDPTGQGNLSVSDFAREQATRRLDRIVKEVDRVLGRDREDAADPVHDLRVATRRFRAVLDTFKDCFPKAGRRWVKRRIREVFAAAGDVRNRDVVAALIGEEASKDAKRLLAERRQFARSLDRSLRGWVKQDFSKRWLQRLELR